MLINTGETISQRIPAPPDVETVQSCVVCTRDNTALVFPVKNCAVLKDIALPALRLETAE
ncbi:MAG: hypothetical protein HXY20_07750 [Acidobacteria bacterium]|nr:hypothetical protein [Acidobacteriota bacterium]